MKTLPENGKVSGFTLIELLVVIAIIAIVAAMLLPANPGHKKAYRLVCQSNQKQIAMGLIIFNDDHAGHYPWQVSATNGGTMECVSSNEAFPHYRALAGFFGKQTAIFVCPKDVTRHLATNSSQILDENISYFLNFDANTNKPSDSILSGDRNLQANGKVVNPGFFAVDANMNLDWTRDFHPGGGNLAFADGHVQWIKTNELNSVIQRQQLATNRFCIP